MPDGISIPGGPTFIGLPQPPDVPCDPTGDGWRGPQGFPGPPGPPGPTGGPIDDVYSIASYGAKSDGITNDSAAVNAAINAAIAGGGGLVLLSAGRTMMGSAVAVSIPAGVAITIAGLGAGVSELYFGNATDGLTFMLLTTDGTVWGGCNLHGFTLTTAGGPTTAPWSNTGIRIYSDPTATRASISSLCLRDLVIGGSVFAATQWLNSIVLDSVHNVMLDHVYVRGHDAGDTDLSDVLLTISGRGLGRFATAIEISHCVLQGGSCGVNIVQFVQGVNIVGSSVIGQYDSVRWDGTANTTAPPGTNFFPEALEMSNSSTNAKHRCVYMKAVNSCTITGTTHLHFGASAAPLGWAAIEINGGKYNTVIGNSIVGANVGTESGILCTDCTTGSTVIGNFTTNVHGIGIYLAGSTNSVTVVGNGMTGVLAATHIVQDTPGNTVLGNTWNGVAQALTTALPVTYINANADARWFAGNDGSTADDFAVIRVDDTGTHILALGISRATGRLTMAVAPIITTLPVNAANDGAAASAGVQIGGIYRNGSAVQIRVS